MRQNKKIGVIIGGGTGKELSLNFGKICSVFDRMVEDSVDIIYYDKHIFRTFWELSSLSDDAVNEVTESDFKNLIEAYSFFKKQDCKVVFRTAINAASLYLARNYVKAAKVIPIGINDKKLILVRDMMQGYYSSGGFSSNKSEITAETIFTKSDFDLLIDFINNFPEKKILKNSEIWFLYKHHLFGNLIQNWIKEGIAESKVYQPDTGIDKLFSYLKNPENDLMIVTGNEIGDVLHEMIILHLGIGSKYTSSTKNHFLSNEYEGMVEYQTVHGSVDDLVGTGKLNPFSMINAAASIYSNEFECSDIEVLTKKIISEMVDCSLCTPDMGGDLTTDNVIFEFMKRFTHETSYA